MGEEAKWRDAFELFDRDSDGKIPSNEIGTVIRALGIYGETFIVRLVNVKVKTQLKRKFKKSLKRLVRTSSILIL
jgi:Ca2+-binding EF-hand superfamily protein